MSNTEEYLPKSRGYFRKFIDSNLKDLFMDMKECRTGPGSGYPKFHRDNEVIDCMRSIYHNLDDTFEDLSVPGSKFTTPQHLIQTWINFKTYLENKDELFTEAATKTLEAMRSNIQNKDISDADLLPFPLLQVNSNRYKALDVLNHILSMEEVRAYTGATSDLGVMEKATEQVKNLCKKFHLVALQMRRRHSNRPTLEIADEYDVQDLFHSLLKIEFSDIRAEEYTPSYAGGSSRMDFILKNEKIAIEIKKTGSSHKSVQSSWHG